jgi:hypothetical protein
MVHGQGPDGPRPGAGARFLHNEPDGPRPGVGARFLHNEPDGPRVRRTAADYV